jgi:hypothetical protein
MLSRLYIMCAFACLTGALAIYMIDNNAWLSWTQWFVVFAGTFGLSRIIAREQVCEPVRKMCSKIGLEELVTCPRCIGVWIDLALVAGMLFAPHYTMLVGSLFGVAGANIIMHEILGILVRYSHSLDIRNANMSLSPTRFDDFNKRFIKGDDQ